MAAKTKTKATKTSEEPGVPTPQTHSTDFHIMNNPQAFAQSVNATLKTVLEKRKGREVDMKPQSEMLISTLPLRSIYFQWMINNRGLPKGVTNLVGKDKLGKTSLIWNLMGGFVQGGIPCILVVCEGKPASAVWAARCMTSDRSQADNMTTSVLSANCVLLEEMAELVLEYCRALRDPKSKNYVPHAIPIVVAADPLNKLATNAQAAGIVTYDGKDKEKQTDIADHGHMWDRAKWLHSWVTQFLLQIDRYNVHLIASEHQNEDGVAGGGSKVPSFIPQYSKELNHRTKPGGQALNQVTNLQLIFADKGSVYSAGDKIARRIIVSPYKNSYGPESRCCTFALKSDDYQDTDNFLDSGLRWDYTEVEWLAECGYLGFEKSGKTLAQERFSSRELGITQASLIDAAQVWRDSPQSFRDRLGLSLEIPGYINVYDTVIKNLKAQTE